MKRFCVFFILLNIAGQAFSQHSHIAYITLADSLYKHHNYQEAANYYQRAIKNSKQPGDIMLKVAGAYVEINNVKEAEPWYEKAKANNASFSDDDTYRYVKALMMLERRKEAEIVLLNFLKLDPNALYARELLDDLQNIGKYFSDTSAFHITPLSINTPVAEFAPAYYKNGIVFASAQPQAIYKKKYHWDNSSFLHLYYSSRSTDQQFQKPVQFDKEINTRFHDGPVAFYANDERMILNRNQQVKLKGKVDVFMSHLALFDVRRDSIKRKWEFTPLPFEDPPYSFAHPYISEDGNTLYFISDQPGGYGGTDIYRSIRRDNKWSLPFNAGPSINTSKNEVFPFFINNTLYFSSDGHGGLGGLDLFKSMQSINGFAPPVNLGYPMNSHTDDFSLITKDHQSGYFSSARKGNDDLFEFLKSAEVIKLAARIHDGITKESLSGASIQLITTNSDDTTLISGSGGNIQFDLPRESAFILIANKDGKTGMLSALATAEGDQHHIVHPVPLYGDTTFIPCIGNVKNDSGLTQNSLSVNIIDETTGKNTAHSNEKSLVSFLGQKGHDYRIEIQNKQGETAVHKLEIQSNDKGNKTWDVTLRKNSDVVALSAHVFNAETNESLSGASVRIVTLAAPDQELVADENGIVGFSLVPGVGYIVVGNKDGLTGMNSGVSEKVIDKNSITLPVPAKSDPLKPVAIVALVTDSNGELLKGAKASITDKKTGENVAGEINNGVLDFFGEHGKSYNINIEHNGHQPTLEEISIPVDSGFIKKIAVVMEDIKPATRLMAAKVFKEKDHAPLGNATVTVITFSDGEYEMLANSEGDVDFVVSDDDGYILFATKNGYTGMHTGVAETGTDKTAIIHPVPARSDSGNIVRIVGKIKNETGAPVLEAEVQAINTRTGETVPAKIENGILSFNGKSKDDYKVSLSAKGYASQDKIIAGDSSASGARIFDMGLRRMLPITASLLNKKGEILQDAVVAVMDRSTGEKIPAIVSDGILSFSGEQGKNYNITVQHKDYQTASEELIIPQMAKAVTDFSIALKEKGLETTYVIAARVFKVSDNAALSDAEVRITSFTEPDIDLVANTEGITEFELPAGSAFILIANKDGYVGMYAGVAEKGEDKASTIHAVPANNDPDKQLPIISLIRDESGKTIPNVHVQVTDNATGQTVEAKVENGVLYFYGKKGGNYEIVLNAEGYEPQIKSVSVDPSASTVNPLDIKLQAVKANLNNDANTLPIVSQITDEAGKPATGVHVQVTDKAMGQTIEAKVENGVLSFYGKKGSNYEIVLNAEGYEPQIKSVSVDPSASTVNPLDIRLQSIKANRNSDTSTLPIVSQITDEAGKPIAYAHVQVTDKATGQTVESKIENGMLSFYGKKGGDYEIALRAKGYEQELRHLSIQPTASTVAALDIKLQPIKPVIFSLAVRILKATDNLPLEEAAVKVTSFTEPDIELIATADGLAEFTLPEGSAYMIIASKDGYVGMYAGVAEKGEDKATVIHIISASNDPDKQLPIVSLITDESGKPVVDAQVLVTDKVTGQRIEAKMEHGILSFYGKKGTDYEIEIKAEDYETQMEKITVDTKASAVEPLEISLTRKKLLALPALSNLIILNNEVPKFYISSTDSHDEIMEKDGMLFIQSENGDKFIGKGSLTTLMKDPSVILEMSEDQAVTLQNIYFDYNTAILDQVDMAELDKAKAIMNRYPQLQLTVKAHADLRGSANYNLALTRKRARAIKSYLVKQGIRPRKVFTRAYGKSVPAVVCETKECTELEHEKNRRAEFELAALYPAKVEPLPIVKPEPVIIQPTARTRTTANYERVLEEYGDRKHDDLVFKVCVGGYRYNANVTFPQLTDLGQVERQVIKEINYYYLNDLPTLKSAELIRQKVIQRGIQDAYVAIFYKGTRVSFQKFISLTE